MVHISKMG